MLGQYSQGQTKTADTLFKSTKIYLNLTIGKDTTKIPLSQIEIRLANKSSINQIPVEENHLIIYEFADTSTINIRYEDWQLSTGSFSYLDFQKIRGIRVKILSRKEIRSYKKESGEPNKKLLAVYKVWEHPLRGIGRYTVITVTKN